MWRKLRHLLIFLLIILKEPNTPEAGCSCSTSTFCQIRPLWFTRRTPCCNCDGQNLTGIPPDLPENIAFLYLGNNKITSFPQNIPKSIGQLELENNQIRSIPPGALSCLLQLVELNLDKNGITNVKPGTFSDHKMLYTVCLSSNNITEIQTGTFSNLPELKRLFLHDNQINQIQPGAFLNLPKLWSLGLRSNRMTSIRPGTFTNLPKLEYLDLEANRLSVLPQSAHGMLPAGIRKIICFEKNPWQCDCRMRPFRLKMTGSAKFENKITCEHPAHLRGQKLKDINPEDLICKETTASTLPFDSHTSSAVSTSSSFASTESTTSPTAHPLSYR
ncbi:PREDICTED: leucine-rich repeat transmembrane protein FLRT3-like [Branchiostoma belcheri]|uniref:Leucine-rich repeat transmembrane protein FLRT3-like n=1 Tax=Branchiostoma belcheri TaxID=7741 RepID=A0A6P4YAV7_BRABE|nr:PREDICTED: leucine-rich repeat transmembrane protein FLRT3-like [Branchiostoma belcheri]